MRWHLKANHPIETNRWVWTLQNAITIAKDNIKRETLTANVEVPRHQQQSNWQQQMKQILNMNTAMNQRKNDTVLEFLVERNTNVFLVCLHLSLAMNQLVNYLAHLPSRTI